MTVNLARQSVDFAIRQFKVEFATKLSVGAFTAYTLISNAHESYQMQPLQLQATSHHGSEQDNALLWLASRCAKTWHCCRG